MKKMILSGWVEERKIEKRELIILKSESKPDERKIINKDDDKNMV